MTLDRMIETGRTVKASCTSCNAEQLVDLVALRARVGGSYTLFNRRCRCRLSPDCPGWLWFQYLHGVYRPLWDADRALDRYSENRHEHA